MSISHVFLLSTIFDSHLLFISVVPLRSFFYLLPSFNKDYLLIETKSLKWNVWPFCQKLTSNPSFYESLDFFIKASHFFLSFGFKAPPH